jgi:hypothetical protein
MRFGCPPVRATSTTLLGWSQSAIWFVSSTTRRAIPPSGAWSSRHFTSPGQKNTDELLKEMRDNRLQMVIVIDEFGTTEGILTLEEMVEEIVGDELEPITALSVTPES